MKKFILPKRFEQKIHAEGETGMGWSSVRVILKNGKVFKNVIVSNDNEISRVYGHDEIPFKVNDIKDVVVTHSKDFPENVKTLKDLFSHEK